MTTEIHTCTESVLAEAATVAHAAMVKLAEAAQQPVEHPETLAGVLEAFKLTLKSATQAIGNLGERVEGATLRRDLVGIPGPDPDRDIRHALASLDECHRLLERAMCHASWAQRSVAELQLGKAVTEC